MGIGPDLPPHLQKSRAQSSHSSSNSDHEEASDDSSIGPNIGPSVGPSIGPSVGPSIGPSIGPSRPPPPEQEVASSEDFAPALPPELLEARKKANVQAPSYSSSERPKRVLGPTLPPTASAASSHQYNASDDSDDDDIVGPVLPSASDRDSLSKQSRIQAFEERAERMRRKLAGDDEEAAAKDAKPTRAEWMMVPPESRILGDDPLKITARTFQKREQKPQDSSLWTETPADREKRLRGDPRDEGEGSSSGRHKKSKRRGSDDDEPQPRSKGDIEREEQIRKYNAEKRSESLFDSHANKYVKSKAWQKNDDKEHDNPSARPFDREKDVLGGRRIDHRQRDELVKQAMDLGSKFSRGKKSAFL